MYLATMINHIHRWQLLIIGCTTIATYIVSLEMDLSFVTLTSYTINIYIMKVISRVLPSILLAVEYAISIAVAILKPDSYGYILHIQQPVGYWVAP